MPPHVTGTDEQQSQAQTVLTQFQDHADSWQKVPEILERSTSTQTKYIALQIMDKLIKQRWKSLPEEQRSGIRNFIVGVIVKTSSDEATLRKEKSYVNKLNLILVQILKQEWFVYYLYLPFGRVLALLPDAQYLTEYHPTGLTIGQHSFLKS